MDDMEMEVAVNEFLRKVEESVSRCCYISDYMDEYAEICGGMIEGAFEIMGDDTITVDNIQKAVILSFYLMRIDAAQQLSERLPGFYEIYEKIFLHDDAENTPYTWGQCAKELQFISEVAKRNGLTGDSDFIAFLGAYVAVVNFRDPDLVREASSSFLAERLEYEPLGTKEAECMVPIMLTLWNYGGFLYKVIDLLNERL